MMIIVVGEDGSKAKPVRKNIFLWSQVLCRRNTRKRHGWTGSRKIGTAEGRDSLVGTQFIGSISLSHLPLEKHVGIIQ